MVIITKIMTVMTDNNINDSYYQDYDSNYRQ